MSTYIPSAQLLKDVRAELVGRGTSFSAFCARQGFTRPAVAAALTGKRRGPNLPRPSRRELAAFAQTLAPESGKLQAILRDLGESAGHFRALATAMRVARGMADGPITPELLRAAIKTMGVR